MTSALTGIDEIRTRASDRRHVSAGSRPGSAILTVGAGEVELPLATELAALLPRVPVAGVRLAEPANFSALTGHTIVRIIALIRECSSIGSRVTWSLLLGSEQLDLIPKLDHLPAPAKIMVLGREAPFVGEWRSSSNFGLFYFRKGPKFLYIVDQRSDLSSQTIVDDPAMIDVFRQALEGCTWAEVTQDQRHAAAAHELVDKGIVMRVGDHCVTLPVHMRSWPVGAALLGGTLASAGKKPDGDTR